MPNAQYSKRHAYFRAWNEDRVKNKGLIRINIWVPQSEAEKLKAKAAKMVKKHLKQLEANNA
jgi:hypothetical protein